MTNIDRLLLGLGNEEQPITLSMDDISRHMFVSGSTGAGKTSLLLSMVANSLSWGSGCMFVDGKGDKDALAGIATIAKRFGREDDLLVLDFTSAAHADGTKRSNTINPFAKSSNSAMTDMVVSMMDDAGGENAMWKGRAISMFGSVMRALSWLRDNSNIELNAQTVREHLNLRRIIDLADARINPDIPSDVRRSVSSYLTSLPGYQTEKGYKQAQTTLDQHGYLHMQFSRLLGALCDDYGDIFADGPGDIDLADVVSNKRILVVLLPMAGRSPDEAAFLGNIIICMLKDMMATMAMSQRRKKAGSPPFMVILDEFGQYTLPGAETVVAQARSLGISVTFATQSMVPTSRDLNGRILDHVLSNTTTKILMRTDMLDHERLRTIVPQAVTADDDEQIANLRIRMQQTSTMAGLPHIAVDQATALTADYLRMARMHDELMKERAGKNLRVVMPALVPGEMLVVKGGAVTKCNAFNMSPLFEGPDPEIRDGIPLDKSLREALLAAAQPQKRASEVAAEIVIDNPLPPKVAALITATNSTNDPREIVRRAVAACYLMSITTDKGLVQ